MYPEDYFPKQTVTLKRVTPAGVKFEDVVLVSPGVPDEPPPVPAPEITSFAVEPAVVVVGASVVLSWTLLGEVTEVKLDGALVSSSPVIRTPPLGTTTYTLTASGPGGTAVPATATVTVTPTPPPPLPVVDLTSDKTSLPAPGPVLLSWTSANATAASLRIASLATTRTVGDLPANGSYLDNPSATTDYALTVTGAGGSATDTATVDVSPAPAPDFNGATWDYPEGAGPKLRVIEVGSLNQPFKIDHEGDVYLPRFWGANTLTFKRPGRFSDPGTWNENRAPADGDLVLVPNFRVDVSAPRRIDAYTIIHNEGALFEVGTDASPVPKGNDVVFNFLPGDRDPLDGSGYGGGFLSTGVLKVRAAKLPTAKAHANSSLPAGTSTVALRSAPTDWEVGDEIFFVDTHRPSGLDSNGPPLPYERGYVSQTEVRKIAEVRDNGKTIVLNAPLTYEHRTYRDSKSRKWVYPAIGHLSRTVRFESAAEGSHHSMFGHTTEASIWGLGVVGMGRTTADPISATNPKRFYPLHWHHGHGATPPDVRNVAVFSRTPDNPRKWPLVVHGTHFGTFKDVVAFNYSGWGIGEEDGNEFGNRYVGCIAAAIRSGGATEVQWAVYGDNRGYADLGWNGSGFWFRGPAAVVEDCEAHDCIIGFVVWSKALSDTVTGPNGTYSPRLVPLNWKTIVAGGGRMAYGGEVWYHGLAPGTALPDPGAAENVIEDYAFYACYARAFYNYVTNRLTFRNGFAVNCKTGLDGTDYAFHNLLIDGLITSDVGSPFVPSTVGENQEARNVIIEKAVAGVGTNNRYGVPSCENGAPRTVTLRNFVAEDSSLLIYKGGNNLGGGVTNLRAKDAMKVYDANGVAGNDFEVFALEAAPDAVMPTSDPLNAGPANPYPNVCGSESPGKTNAELKALYGYCMHGVLPPTGTGTLPGVHGLVYPRPAVGETLAARRARKAKSKEAEKFFRELESLRAEEIARNGGRKATDPAPATSA